MFSNVGFTARSGDQIVIHGPNGVGKSSLLKVILGFLPIKDGKIYINGEELTYQSGDRQEFFGYIGHQDPLNNGLTVKETLEYWKSFFLNVKSDVEEIVNFWEIPDIAVERCSKGQKKRISLARVLIMNRPIWLLDEPTANLDKNGGEKVVKCLDQHSSKGGISIITTHMPELFSASAIINLSDYVIEEKDK